MDGESVKNDLKTSFLIANTVNALVGGLFPLSICVGMLLTEGLIWPVGLTLGFGAPIAALATLGYHAAFNVNKKMLHIYSAIMALVAALEILAVVANIIPIADFAFDPTIIIFGNLHIGITLAAVSLAVALAKRVPDDIPSGLKKSSRLPCFLKYLGYGSVIMFIFICFSYFS